MKICLIYYSKSGNTKLIADRIKAKLENKQHQLDLIEIKPVKQPGFFKAAFSAIKQKELPIKNDPVDLTRYDKLIFGAPLWGGKPASFIKTFLGIASGLEGKACSFYITCAGNPEKQSGGFDVFRENLTSKGLVVAAKNPGIQINRKGVILNESVLDEFTGLILD